jgi:excisionase family DNA binding protein
MSSHEASQHLSETMPAHEAAAYLGIAFSTLSTWRCTKRYPLPYIKVGRSVRYRRADLDAFLASRTVGSEGEAAK